MSSTPAQQQAITASGNVLVVAGAGTGKTYTLVERCLNCLLEGNPRASIDEILMVTFTEAAAAEMRQRIRERLEEQLKRAPQDPRWQEQLALFESAHIGTLHSFCFELVRQHFYELELDPNLVVLPEEEGRLLAEETLDHLFRKHYAGETPAATAVQELIHVQGRGSDGLIRSLVLRLHDYTQTLPDPSGWFDAQRRLFADPDPATWRAWLAEAVIAWHHRWLPLLSSSCPGNELAAQCAQFLRASSDLPAHAAPIFQAVIAAFENVPRGRKTACTQPLREFRAETEFLAAFYQAQSKEGEVLDPLAEDWAWVRPHMLTLLDLALEFSLSFSEAKRELGAVDFHDLEQHALRLLRDPVTGLPTRIGQEWRRKLRFVFVDEYQDINAAQDKIIEALSREPQRGNRFLVGDVKQSIYRFRLANPHIFQGYAETWRPPVGLAIPLLDNFRSRESILAFVNSFFRLIMSEEIGGVAYNDRAELRFGDPVERAPLSLAANPERCVELHLRVRGSPAQAEFEEIMESVPRLADLGETEKEARLVALRLAELKARQYPVWDDGAFRPVDWSDMAVLLRSPSGKAEAYAKEFARLNIPLLVARGGFYESQEILDLLSLLQILDNPLQDIPLIAVLHSPLAGLDINELAAIRLAARGPFWKALLVWKASPGDSLAPEPGASSPDTREKVHEFLERFAAWRRLARRVSLSQCLESVLAETHYAAWLLAQSRGQQRHANVQRLLALARQFDRFQRQGLFRFLKFVEAQQAAETQPEVPPVCEENAVRLMSIHQSKGLEFPVVVLPDLGKSFNLSDLRADVILDEQYGLCPQVKPPHTGRRYPSLPFWLARRRQLRETLGEEARLLYVAMTRARDLLLLTATINRSSFAKRWLTPAAVTPETLASALRSSDWLAQWFAHNAAGADPAATRGQNAFLRWMLHEDTALLESPLPQGPEAASSPAEAATDAEAWRKLQERLTWQYPFPYATQQPAKTSVTTLRRQAAEFDESAPLNLDAPSRPKMVRRGSAPDPARAGSEVGIAHHAFLQHVSSEALRSRQQLESERDLFVRESVLTAEQAETLDLEGLAAFWDSPLGLAIRDQWAFVVRELEFTARFAPAELAQITGRAPNLEGEFVVVQGVVDLAVIAKNEIWIVDFKTDVLERKNLLLKTREYSPQLKLYAKALERIYGLPVTQAWLHFLHLRRSSRVDL